MCMCAHKRFYAGVPQHACVCMSEHFVHFDILDSIYPSSRNVASAVGYVAFHVKKNKDIYNEVTF